MPDPSGPFVVLATLCERVEERPGGQIDIIGTIQRTTVKQTEGGGPSPFQPFEFPCSAIVALCAQFPTMTYHVRVEMVNPDGARVAFWRDEARFRGEGRTRVLVFQDLRIPIGAPGLYWFDVFVRNRLVTRFPFRVEYEPMEAT